MFDFLQTFNLFYRKWNRLCVSYDFDRNEAQMSFSGSVSDLIKDPVSSPNMNGQITFRYLISSLTTECCRKFRCEAVKWSRGGS